MGNKQLFFSHTWRPDKLGRNTHSRVHQIVKKIRGLGWTTWFDEEDMNNNIDAAMAQGIDTADVVIICLTENYINKINETSKNPRLRDNCLKEWNYTHARYKFVIPIIMESCLLNVKDWPAGVVSLYLGSNLYINASSDNLDDAVINLSKMLIKNDIMPQKKILLNNDILGYLTNMRDNKNINKNNKIKENYDNENNIKVEEEAYKKTIEEQKILDKYNIIPTPPKHRKPPPLPSRLLVHRHSI